MFLAIIAGYLLVIRSMETTGNKYIPYLENENSKFSKMKQFNKKHKRTVKEEIIDNMLQEYQENIMKKVI